MPDEPEVPLPGGNVGGAVRVGQTVRRPTGPWTPAVHALLAHLVPRLDAIPVALGRDELGREVLSYLPGEVIDPATEVLSPARLTSLVTWTRRFHDAVQTFWHPGPWRYLPVDDATIIGHNDIAPYNACFDGDDLAGVFDWDLAAPTTPLREAFIAWNGVPLWAETPARDAARRLEIIAAAYPGYPAATILRAVPDRIELMLDGIMVGATAGDPGMTALLAAGEPHRSLRPLDRLRRRIPAIARELG